MRHTKIAIIGAGAVGSTTAFALILKNIAAEIILVDINKERCKGEMLDLSDALAFSGTSKIRSSSIEDVKDADIIIITAGIAQKPGETRVDLIKTNKKIVTSIIRDLKPIAQHSIIIVVTNPVDAMTFFALKESGLEPSRVFGTGTILDTQRIRGLLSRKLNIAEQSIHAYILGEHGDSQFPAWSSARIAGVPIENFPGITKKDLDAFAIEARQKAYEIIKCKGSTFFGIAACTTAICENIVLDQKRIAPLSVFIEKFGLCLGMPATMGCEGIEQIIETPLNKKEEEQLKLSAEKIRETINTA